MAEDKFYMRNNSIEWMYYNPDSDAGGQYVYNMLNARVINNAAKASKMGASEFFDRLGSECDQYLVDRGTCEFAEEDQNFNTIPGDLEECTEETMAALIAFAHEQLHGNEEASRNEFDSRGGKMEYQEYLGLTAKDEKQKDSMRQLNAEEVDMRKTTIIDTSYDTVVVRCGTGEERIAIPVYEDGEIRMYRLPMGGAAEVAGLLTLPDEAELIDTAGMDDCADADAVYEKCEKLLERLADITTISALDEDEDYEIEADF
jgi:hypothetical protein